MTTEQKNEYLAEFMGWRRKGHVKFSHSWDNFQLVFQKAFNNDEGNTAGKIIAGRNIYEAFRYNNPEKACDVLIGFLKQKGK